MRITREELGVNVRLADPTLYRNLTLPLVKAVLARLNEPKLANALEKLGTIFGGYGEWGQPVHDVGNDVRILGLPIRRPDTEHAFRMLCRHNKYVQEFGQVRDPDEIARRERALGRAPRQGSSTRRATRRRHRPAGVPPAARGRSSTSRTFEPRRRTGDTPRGRRRATA